MTRRNRKVIENLFSVAENISERKYSTKQIEGLPEPVQKYFKYSLTNDQHIISYVRLIHGGKFKPKDSWVKIRGEEYFTVEKPGFVWLGRTSMFSASDSYIDGVGNLQVKLLSIIKLVDEKGDKLNQGELLRWLGEAPLFPTALLPSENLRWESIDDESARVIFTNNNLTVEGIFFFNEKGQIIKFTAKRYKDAELEDWTGYYDNYRKINNLRIPFKMKVEWNLASGNLEYVDFDIETIEFNIPEKF